MVKKEHLIALPWPKETGLHPYDPKVVSGIKRMSRSVMLLN